VSNPLDAAALDAHPLPKVVDGDKETKGRILVIAGSRDVPGAALLAATAAMRAGAGKLRIATVESRAAEIGVAMPEAMVTGLAEDDEGGFARAAVEPLAKAACDADAVVAGPGLAANATCGELGQALLRTDAALALDAAILRQLKPLPDSNRKLPPVLLPHAGELASLLDCDEHEVEAEPESCGLRAARRFGAVVLVKGVDSRVVTPDGDCWIYKGGAPGLGVSGSGDALAGIVGGLLSRGAEPLNALLWAVWLHGEAGAALARNVGPIGFLAREIAGEVPGLLPR
jgi:ADP-dependent NAD(P)H-hydrate dehydratase